MQRKQCADPRVCRRHGILPPVRLFVVSGESSMIGLSQARRLPTPIGGQMSKFPRAVLALLFLASFSFAAISIGSSIARADAIEDFYAKHAVTIIVGADAGGTYDLYARTI